MTLFGVCPVKVLEIQLLPHYRGRQNVHSNQFFLVYIFGVKQGDRLRGSVAAALCEQKQNFLKSFPRAFPLFISLDVFILPGCFADSTHRRSLSQVCLGNSCGGEEKPQSDLKQQALTNFNTLMTGDRGPASPTSSTKAERGGIYTADALRVPACYSACGGFPMSAIFCSLMRLNGKKNRHIFHEPFHD